ncbi:MAG: hypothetical protein DI585_02180 [Pseudomonas fluorescens]|nr:MAG: hypothetical protein DI585_02180 [Pseudomonas fluorescens]
MRQLLLDITALPRFHASRWLTTEGTRAAEAALERGELCVCLYGPAGGGKSHMLALAASKGAVVGDKLESLEEEGQERLFHALNAKSQVVVASSMPVAQLDNLLPDLKSRLLTGIQIEVLPPSDDDLRNLLRHWAVVMQLSLPDAVVDYILMRADRSTHGLAAIMARLDALSLEQKRAVTVPLARAVLEGDD